MIGSDYRLVLFESSLRENYFPLSLTKPICDLNFGTGSLLESVEDLAESKISDLFVPSYLESLAIQSHANRQVNKHVSTKCVLINSLISHNPQIWKFIEGSLPDHNNAYFLDSEKDLVFAVLDETSPEHLSAKYLRSIQKRALPPEVNNIALMRYPWNLIQENGHAISNAFSKHASSSNTPKNFELRGEKISISPSADVERYVTFDSRSGPIIIDDGAEIQSFTHITGPSFVGKGSKVRSARIRGNTSIGQNCRMAGEVEESIISDFTNKSHEGFIGHSYIGSWVNLGAQTTNSDLKNTYGNVKVNIGRNKIDTGITKVGTFVGDMAKTAIGTMITSGCRIGVCSQLFGTITSDVPSFTFFAESLGARNVEQYIQSSVETQTRVMRRRGVEISKAYIGMMKHVFEITKTDRTAKRIRKGRFKL